MTSILEKLLSRQEIEERLVLPIPYDATPRERMLQEAEKEALQTAEQLYEVAIFYLTPRFLEPLGIDGRCRFCQAQRVSYKSTEEKHRADCAWWLVAKSVHDEGESHE